MKSDKNNREKEKKRLEKKTNCSHFDKNENLSTRKIDR
jgi:hypothetical protein